MILTDYLNLIPQENREKEKFIANLTALVEPLIHLQDVDASLIREYDIDYAVGVQLDVVGEWVGKGREVPVPLDFYFTWGGTIAEGWGQGIWKGKFDPDSGITILTDDLYRALLYSKVTSNSWDGNLDVIYEILVLGTGADVSQFTVTDNQDMTMTIDTTGLTELQQAMLDQDVTILKPMGVGLTINHA
ncbi:MAG: DUF2612 domain-containing protein [Candidatus Diapherotrites archaeon]|nr:DUF2612 domain-containing protein [Candidatus Diapherotrites archaeon]